MSSRGKFVSEMLIFLMVVQGVSVLLFCHWYVQYHPVDFSPNEGKVHVLLLSSWRSGSTFMGQVFNQKLSVFYLMEPSWHVWNKVEKPGVRLHRKAVSDLLQSLFLCDFSVMDSYLPENPRVSSLFRWTESRALCSPLLCSLNTSDETLCLQKCKTRDLQKVEEVCRTHSHVVIKETRLFELESLYPLLQDPNLDLRIVHLVRDPRAVFRSRVESAGSLVKGSAVILEQKNIPAAEVQYKVMREVCRSHVRIYETAVLKPPSFLEGRYKLVRYEDMARNPLKEIDDIYEFAGLEMTTEMGMWVYKKTHGTRRGTPTEAFQIISRNASLVSQAWRTMLPYSKVQRVQEVCKGAMELLGYKTIQSEEEQKTLDLDLLNPRETY